MQYYDDATMAVVADLPCSEDSLRPFWEFSINFLTSNSLIGGGYP